mmetsp:Transcript_29466/g.54065  ORF Transcript_29466/g.54065 Transcript_29466/m.54065 type:complete len:105 (+) Transcript_29466:1390-1704(+)
MQPISINQFPICIELYQDGNDYCTTPACISVNHDRAEYQCHNTVGHPMEEPQRYFGYQLWISSAESTNSSKNRTSVTFFFAPHCLYLSTANRSCFKPLSTILFS